MPVFRTFGNRRGVLLPFGSCNPPAPRPRRASHANSWMLAVDRVRAIHQILRLLLKRPQVQSTDGRRFRSRGGRMRIPIPPSGGVQDEQGGDRTESRNPTRPSVRPGCRLGLLCLRLPPRPRQCSGHPTVRLFAARPRSTPYWRLLIVLASSMPDWNPASVNRTYFSAADGSSLRCAVARRFSSVTACARPRRRALVTMNSGDGEMTDLFLDPR